MRRNECFYILYIRIKCFIEFSYCTAAGAKHGKWYSALDLHSCHKLTKLIQPCGGNDELVQHPFVFTLAVEYKIVESLCQLKAGGREKPCVIDYLVSKVLE